jgi:hypothetical protein
MIILQYQSRDYHQGLTWKRGPHYRGWEIFILVLGAFLLSKMPCFASELQLVAASVASRARDWSAGE